MTYVSHRDRSISAKLQYLKPSAEVNTVENDESAPDTMPTDDDLTTFFTTYFQSCILPSNDVVENDSMLYPRSSAGKFFQVERLIKCNY